MRRILMTVVGVTTAVLAAIGPAPAAQAHTELIGTDPGQGKTVKTVPEFVALQFSQPLLEVGARVEVTGPDGAAADGEPKVAGAAVVVPLKPGLAAGDYRVAWRVTSPDGHPIDGTFRFTASGPGEGAAEPTPSATPTEVTAPTTPAAAPTETAIAAGPTSGTPTTTWTIVGVVIVAAGLLAALVALRRPRRGPPPSSE